MRLSQLHCVQNLYREHQCIWRFECCVCAYAFQRVYIYMASLRWPLSGAPPSHKTQQRHPTHALFRHHWALVATKPVNVLIALAQRQPGARLRRGQEWIFALRSFKTFGLNTPSVPPWHYNKARLFPLHQHPYTHPTPLLHLHTLLAPPPSLGPSLQPHTLTFTSTPSLHLSPHLAFSHFLLLISFLSHPTTSPSPSHTRLLSPLLTSLPSHPHHLHQPLPNSLRLPTPTHLHLLSPVNLENIWASM